MNAVAHVTAYLGNQLQDRFATGDSFVTQDGKKHPRNSQYPIIVLSAKPGQIKNLMEKVRNSGLLYIGFIREMIETSDDEAIARTLSQKLDQEIEYLAVGVLGGREQLDGLTKNFSLWKPVLPQTESQTG